MVPLLRPEVQTFVDPRGLIVYDPTTGLRVLLGPESTILWNAMVGGVGSPASLRRATPELSDSQRFVRLMQLDQALLLASPRWRRQEHLFHTRSKAVDSPIYVHPHLTHQCVGCGSSCHEVYVGPLSALTTAVIRSNELWRSAPGATRAEDVWVEAEIGEQKGLMLKQFESRCAVWSAETGCTIHATGGHKLKPVPCQQYPYTLTRTSRGVYVGLQVSCRSLLPSLEAGNHYRPTEVAQTLAPLVMSGGQTFTLPAPAPLSSGSYIPESAIEEWWRWAVKVVEKGFSELEAKGKEYMNLRFWPGVIEELNDYVHEWLLRVDESDESEQWLDYERWLSQSILPTRYEVRESFVDELRLALQEAAALHQEGRRWQEMKRIERLYDALEVWSGRWPLPPLRSRGPGGERLMLLTVLEAVHSHRLFLQGDLVFGLAHLKLHLELAEALARVEAYLAGRSIIEDTNVNDALALVYQAFREPVVDGALKRWAGGLRWLMSPSGIPYRHGLGTLEPHLFKHSSHLQLRMSVERARQIEVEAGKIALSISPSGAQADFSNLPASSALPIEPKFGAGSDFEGVSLLSQSMDTPPPEIRTAPKASPADPYPTAKTSTPPAQNKPSGSPVPRKREQGKNPLVSSKAQEDRRGPSSPYDRAASQRVERQRARVSEAIKGVPSISKSETSKDPEKN